MTGGQASLTLDSRSDPHGGQGQAIRRLPADRPRLPVINASEEEQRAHLARLEAIEKACQGPSVWRQLDD
jgi:DNA polymerase-3 subunit epsilon